MSRTHALDRWLYRGRRAHWLARRINSATARLAASGRGPAQLYTLEVHGRRSGKLIRFPVVVAEYEGERYLVSMLGSDTNWVRNVRAADGRALLVRGRREAVRLVEIDSGDRGAILRQYLRARPARSRTSTSRQPRRSRSSTGSRCSTRSSASASWQMCRLSSRRTGGRTPQEQVTFGPCERVTDR